MHDLALRGRSSRILSTAGCCLPAWLADRAYAGHQPRHQYKSLTTPYSRSRLSRSSRPPPALSRILPRSLEAVPARVYQELTSEVAGSLLLGYNSVVMVAHTAPEALLILEPTDTGGWPWGRICRGRTLQTKTALVVGWLRHSPRITFFVSPNSIQIVNLSTHKTRKKSPPDSRRRLPGCAGALPSCPAG